MTEPSTKSRVYDAREEFWTKRAKCYGRLEWATKGGYLHCFLDSGRFEKGDSVLDLGTGTGIVAHTLSPHVGETFGVDISHAMLAHALKGRVRNEIFLLSDARNLPFLSHTFTRVTARMVFHHILEDTQRAMNECLRVLRRGGLMVFSEGVPPSEHVKPFYIEMFRLKEDRLTFMEGDLEALLLNAGFHVRGKTVHWSRRSSIRNWLQNSGLPKTVQERIFRMHLDLDERGKKDYHMVVSDNDCFIDMKFCIYLGEKE